MIRRILALAIVLWACGFLWFAMALPQPAGAEKTDAVVVPADGFSAGLRCCAGERRARCWSPASTKT